MKFYFSVILTFCIATSLSAQETIGSFISVPPGNEIQAQSLIIPLTHTFQILFREGDPITGGGNLPGGFDFTGYVPENGSSEKGVISLNHEIGPGAVTTHRVQFDYSSFSWKETSSAAINFSPLVNVYRPCAGSVTPWNTILIGEESLVNADADSNGYSDGGWVVELDPVLNRIIDHDGDGAPDKIWKAGRAVFESGIVNPLGTVMYAGCDHPRQGFLFKFLPDSARNFSSGRLFALQRNSFTTGRWIQIANGTPEECNNSLVYAGRLGATNFNGVEEVEFGPDGLIYFASKGNGKVLRFHDDGDTVSAFEVYVGGRSYKINYGSGKQDVDWGFGNDNLAFDNEGNLWVLQDGGYNHIWLVRAGHTQLNPKVELFGRTPAGSEPTGITFTPDNRFMFISFQHPSSSNSNLQADCFGNRVKFDRNTTVVIARDENLGANASHEVFNPFKGFLSPSGIVTLVWIFVPEPDGDDFILERGQNGGEFVPIVNLEIEKGKHNYSFLDLLPAHGTYYYRVQKHAGNGGIDISPVIQIDYYYEGELTMEIYPVPATTDFTFVLNSPFDQIGAVELIDFTGRKVKEVPIETVGGNSFTNTIDIRDLSSGMYQVVFRNKWGAFVSKKIAVQ